MIRRIEEGRDKGTLPEGFNENLWKPTIPERFLRPAEDENTNDDNREGSSPKRTNSGEADGAPSSKKEKLDNDEAPVNNDNADGGDDDFF